VLRRRLISSAITKPGRSFLASLACLASIQDMHGYLYCSKKQMNCYSLQPDDILRPKDRNPAGVKAAQEALWAKPLAWSMKLHP
jgi:hypothetical protein